MRSVCVAAHRNLLPFGASVLTDSCAPPQVRPGPFDKALANQEKLIVAGVAVRIPLTTGEPHFEEVPPVVPQVSLRLREVA